MPAISVIMAAYNASHFIIRAIDSVLSQTFHDFELLIVDDGSTDETASICDEYASKDNRIRVFHKDNGGVASARQMGLDNVKGEYVIHFDADDYADSRMLEEMYSTAKSQDADMVIADVFIKENNKDIFLLPQPFDSMNSSDVIISILKGGMLGVLWNKLVRTSVIDMLSATFESGIDYCEDNLFVAKLVKDDKIKVVHQDKAYYVYCFDKTDSLTRKYEEKTFVARKLYFDRISSLLSEPKFSNALKCDYFDIRLEAYRNNYVSLFDFDDKNFFSLVFLRHAPASKTFRVKLMLIRLVHILFSKTRGNYANK